jgi:hypothetical protein
VDGAVQAQLFAGVDRVIAREIEVIEDRSAHLVVPRRGVFADPTPS